MEYLDIVDAKDNVIGTTTKQNVYEQKLRHRIVHVLVLNSQKEVALQKRGAAQSFLPGYWGTTVGGHVRHGETYEEAARRECREEIGLELPITCVSKLTYFSPSLQTEKVLSIFSAVYDGTLHPTSSEGDVITFFSQKDIRHMLLSNAPLMPELAHILQHIPPL